MGVSEPPAKTREIVVSPTDPDARYMGRTGKPKGFHYLSHETSDAESGIVTDVHVTPRNVNEVEPVVSRMKHQIETFGFTPQAFGADKGYDYGSVHAGMLELGIKTYIPSYKRYSPAAGYASDMFRYDVARNVYICPNNCELHSTGFHKRDVAFRYSTRKKDCRDCPLRDKCVPSSLGTRTISRPYHQTEVELQQKNNMTSEYKRVQRLRSEPAPVK